MLTKFKNQLKSCLSFLLKQRLKFEKTELYNRETLKPSKENKTWCYRHDRKQADRLRRRRT